MYRLVLLVGALALAATACTEAPRPQPRPPLGDGPDLAQPVPADLTGVANPGVDLAESGMSITGVLPRQALTSGGATITVTGAGFLPGTLLFINGALALRTGVGTPTSITATVPPAPGAYGKVPVVVRNPSGAAVANNAASTPFSYVSTTITYGAGVPLPLGSSPYGAVAADFNEDGMLDLAVGMDGSVYTVLLNGGGGVFNRADYGGCSASYAVRAGDYNKDGHLDLLLACYNNNYLGFHPGQVGGDGKYGTFGSLQATSANVDRPNQLVTADFDGDGKLDAVTSAISAYFYAYRGNGNGSFTALTSYGTASSSVYGLAAGDLNKDGKLDVVAANSGNSTLDVFLGNGDLTFQGRSNYAAGFNDPEYLEIADLDGDGYPEIVVSSQATATNTLTVMKNTNGGFSVNNKLVLSTAVNPREVRAVDINGDGFLDLVVLCAQNNPGNRVSIFLGRGDGTFSGRADVATNTQSSFGMVVGNFYGPKPDLVVMQRGASPFTAVLLQNISQ